METKSCLRCYEKIPLNAKVCEYCGTSLPTISSSKGKENVIWRKISEDVFFPVALEPFKPLKTKNLGFLFKNGFGWELSSFWKPSKLTKYMMLDICGFPIELVPDEIKLKFPDEKIIGGIVDENSNIKFYKIKTETKLRWVKDWFAWVPLNHLREIGAVETGVDSWNFGGTKYADYLNSNLFSKFGIVRLSAISFQISRDLVPQEIREKFPNVEKFEAGMDGNYNFRFQELDEERYKHKNPAPKYRMTSSEIPFIMPHFIKGLEDEFDYYPAKLMHYMLAAATSFKSDFQLDPNTPKAEKSELDKELLNVLQGTKPSNNKLEKMVLTALGKVIKVTPALERGVLRAMRHERDEELEIMPEIYKTLKLPKYKEVEEIPKLPDSRPLPPAKFDRYMDIIAMHIMNSLRDIGVEGVKRRFLHILNSLISFEFLANRLMNHDSLPPIPKDAGKKNFNKKIRTIANKIVDNGLVGSGPLGRETPIEIEAVLQTYDLFLAPDKNIGGKSPIEILFFSPGGKVKFEYLLKHWTWVTPGGGQYADASKKVPQAAVDAFKHEIGACLGGVKFLINSLEAAIEGIPMPDERLDFIHPAEIPLLKEKSELILKKFINLNKFEQDRIIEKYQELLDYKRNQFS